MRYNRMVRAASPTEHALRATAVHWLCNLPKGVTAPSIRPSAMLCNCLSNGLVCEQAAPTGCVKHLTERALRATAVHWLCNLRKGVAMPKIWPSTMLRNCHVQAALLTERALRATATHWLCTLLKGIAVPDVRF